MNAEFVAPERESASFLGKLAGLGAKGQWVSGSVGQCFQQAVDVGFVGVVREADSDCAA